MENCVTGANNSSSHCSLNDTWWPRITIIGYITTTGWCIHELSLYGVSFNRCNTASLIIVFSMVPFNREIHYSSEEVS